MQITLGELLTLFPTTLICTFLHKSRETLLFSIENKILNGIYKDKIIIKKNKEKRNEAGRQSLESLCSKTKNKNKGTKYVLALSFRATYVSLLFFFLITALLFCMICVCLCNFSFLFIYMLRICLFNEHLVSISFWGLKLQTPQTFWIVKFSSSSC